MHRIYRVKPLQGCGMVESRQRKGHFAGKRPETARIHTILSVIQFKVVRSHISGVDWRCGNVDAARS